LDLGWQRQEDLLDLVRVKVGLRVKGVGWGWRGEGGKEGGGESERDG
jgi:exonuclease I